MKTNNMTEKIILTGLMMALVTVATMVISIPVPFTSGYIHLGDSMIFLSVLILGWKFGAMAAGVGSALADMLLGYAQWAPWTLCIKGLMAVFMGLIIQKCIDNKKNTILACIVTALTWVAFNFGVQQVVSYQALHNAESLFEDAGASNVSELGVFLNGMQSKLMIVALIIPIALILISFIIRRTEKIVIPIYQILAMTTAGLWMVFGYYIAGGLIYGNFAASAFSIPANMIQFAGGFFIASLVSAALLKTPARKFFAYKTSQKLKNTQTLDKVETNQSA